jgi:hypothetical protein
MFPVHWYPSRLETLKTSEFQVSPSQRAFVTNAVLPGILPQILGWITLRGKQAAKIWKRRRIPMSTVQNGRQLALRSVRTVCMDSAEPNVGQLPCITSPRVSPHTDGNCCSNSRRSGKDLYDRQRVSRCWRCVRWHGLGRFGVSKTVAEAMPLAIPPTWFPISFRIRSDWNLKSVFPLPFLMNRNVTLALCGQKSGHITLKLDSKVGNCPTRQLSPQVEWSRHV